MASKSPGYNPGLFGLSMFYLQIPTKQKWRDPESNWDTMIFSGVVCVRRSSWLFRISCKSIKYWDRMFLVVRHCSWRVGVQHATRKVPALWGCPRNEPAICSYLRIPRYGLPLPHSLREEESQYDKYDYRMESTRAKVRLGCQSSFEQSRYRSAVKATRR